jgi:hypothetical protein
LSAAIFEDEDDVAAERHRVKISGNGEHVLAINDLTKVNNLNFNTVGILMELCIRFIRLVAVLPWTSYVWECTGPSALDCWV